MRRILFLLPLVAFLLLAGRFASSLVSGNDPSVIPSPLIDQPAPPFNLPPLPGHDHGLSSDDLKGQVQIVNIFASWCIPCRAEAPVLMGLARTARVPIRGINQKDKPEDALAYLRELGDPYASIGMDSDRRVSIDWGAYGAPETFIVDTEGRIRYKQASPLTEADVRDRILPMIAKLTAK
jgi:cytochrome c biogenesis protein CcmG/thiol:disulfide interchange protein DsbE